MNVVSNTALCGSASPLSTSPQTSPAMPNCLRMYSCFGFPAGGHEELWSRGVQKKLTFTRRKPELRSVLAISTPLREPCLKNRKQFMTKGRQRARRLAIYLTCIEIPFAPMVGTYKKWVADLQAQYNALEVGQQKLARQAGRRLIKGAGSIATALAILPDPVVQLIQTESPPSTTRTRSGKRQFDEVRQRWSALTPPCPSCRMRNGFPKRSWPTREWADEVWGRQHDRDALRVYQCPVQPGFWHLGHVRAAVLAHASTSLGVSFDVVQNDERPNEISR
jgi:hypothetical protein